MGLLTEREAIWVKKALKYNEPKQIIDTKIVKVWYHPCHYIGLGAFTKYIKINIFGFQRVMLCLRRKSLVLYLLSSSGIRGKWHKLMDSTKTA